MRQNLKLSTTQMARLYIPILAMAFLTACASSNPDTSTPPKSTATNATNSGFTTLPYNPVNPSTLTPQTPQAPTPPPAGAPPPTTPPPTVSLSSHVIYRAWRSSDGDFLFSQTQNEGTGAGYGAGVAAFSMFDQTAGSRRSLHRCFNPYNGGHFISVSDSCEGFTPDGILGYVETAGVATAGRALYRCFGPTGTHLATLSPDECLNAGFTVESPVLGYVP